MVKLSRFQFAARRSEDPRKTFRKRVIIPGFSCAPSSEALAEAREKQTRSGRKKRAFIAARIRQRCRGLQMSFICRTLQPMRIARVLVLALVALGALGAGRKPALSVGFHAEANARDGEPFAMR